MLDGCMGRDRDRSLEDHVSLRGPEGDRRLRAVLGPWHCPRPLTHSSAPIRPCAVLGGAKEPPGRVGVFLKHAEPASYFLEAALL